MTPGERARLVDVVGRLVAVARVDPVYRDLYLRRGRALLAGVCAAPDLDRLQGLERGLRHAEEEARAAVLTGDWPRVKQLAAGITTSRATLEAHRADMELAAAVYRSHDVPIDPFSPGLAVLLPGQPDPVVLRARALETLAALERDDPAGAALYATRQSYLARLDVGAGTGDRATPVVDPAQAEVEALDDLRHGRFEELGRLAQRMLVRAAPEGAGHVNPADRDGLAACLGTPFPAEAVDRGRALGMVHVRLPAEPAVADYLRRVAWTPAFAQAELLQDGATRIDAALADPVIRGFREPARETLALFALHPYLNSGGARYLPRLIEETVLVEDFPEDREPPTASPLLDILGMRGRRGLARVEIDAALLEKGPDALETLVGLDPLHYQLVCIPSDVYNRAGAAHGWGRAPVWTHFDGYQLMRSGHLRALVGGDVRYGGRADLVSIARDDGRDKVILRFAAVRRERMLGRWA